MRRALDRHRPAHMHVGRLDLAPGEAERREHVERRLGELLGGSPSASVQNASPSVHLLKAKRMSKAVGSAFSSRSIASGVKPFAFSAA